MKEKNLLNQNAPTTPEAMYAYAKELALQNDNVGCIEWLTKASDLGHTEADRALVQYYISGVGVERSYAAAVKHLRRLSETGDARSQLFLATMLRSGSEVEQNIPEAIDLLVKASNELPEASYELGVIYLNGEDGNEPNPAFGIAFLLRAAEHGLKEAHFALYQAYSSDTSETSEESQKKALEYLIRAAEQQHPEALFVLAQRLEKDVEIEQNLGDAIELLKQSAEAGFAEAQGYLALKYLRGEGIEEDTSAGLEWLNKAVEQNEPIAQFLLSQILLEGELCDQNLQRGFELLQASAEQGFEHAQEMLQKLLDLPDEEDEEDED